VDIKQLEYFLQVAEFGSFTQAGAFLTVGQSSLSRNIAELEGELGVELFERNSKGVILTEAGGQLLEHARGILAQVSRATQEIKNHRNGDAGELTLALPSSLAHVVTVPLVKAFAELLPNARLGFSEGLSAYILEWLSIGRIDCAFVYNAAMSEGIDIQPLLDDQLFLIAPVSGQRQLPISVALRDLAEYPLIIPGRPHATRMAVEQALANIGLKIRVAHEVASIASIVDLVRQGLGYGVLSMNAVQTSQWADHVLVRSIVDPTLMLSLSIVTSTRRPKSAFMRKAIALTRDVVREEMVKSLAKHPRLMKHRLLGS
jgi:LysR family transcriptional regulator, nitrogen assimilation regulatory protein